MNRAELIQTAIDHLKNSYAPYSGFCVSAAVLAESGEVYTGVNVENASYGATVCAERSAVFNAVSHGERKMTAIAIVGGRGGSLTDYCPPCGICRQVIREFCNPEEFTVITAKSVLEYKEQKLSELLPDSFGPDHLG